MATVRWDPLRDLLSLHEQLGHLVGADAPGWTPPVDLYETADAFVLVAELPGLTRDQVDLRVEDRRVVIRGARQTGPSDTHVPCEHYHQVERGHGRFSRAFALPESVDARLVRAELKDGLLTVTLPKASPGGIHRVPVT